MVRSSRHLPMSSFHTACHRSDIYSLPNDHVNTCCSPYIYRLWHRYADESGAVLSGFSFAGSQSVSIAEYIGANGLEEMHVFLGLAWFDLGSWAWAHFIAEWGTKGIFQVRRWFSLHGFQYASEFCSVSVRLRMPFVHEAGAPCSWLMEFMSLVFVPRRRLFPGRASFLPGGCR